MNRYASTILNHTLGHFWFEAVVMKKAEGNDGKIILSFDPDDRTDMEAMPALLDALKKHKMRASFAAIGTWVQEYPDIWKRVLKEGHEIINHTQTHPDNAELNNKHYHKISLDERRTEIAECHETVRKVLGVDMKGFRTPHFGYQHTKDTYDILNELGYTFSSSVLMAEAKWQGPHSVNEITEFPLSPCPSHPWALFDSAHAFRGRLSKHTQESFMKDWKRLLASGVFLNIYLDPQDLQKFDFEKVLAGITKQGLKTVVYEELL